MTAEQTTHRTTVINVPEAVGVFDSFEALQQAIYDLRMAGFSRYDISLLGSQEAMKEKLGQAYWRAEDLEDNPDAPRAAFVSEEAIGELEGAIAGGFFFLGSYIAMGGHADACLDVGGVDRRDRGRGRTCRCHRVAFGAARRPASQGLLRGSNTQWRYPALGPDCRCRQRGVGGEDPEGSFRPGCSRTPLERVTVGPS